MGKSHSSYLKRRMQQYLQNILGAAKEDEMVEVTKTDYFCSALKLSALLLLSKWKSAL